MEKSRHKNRESSSSLDWSDLRKICCGNRSGQLKSYLTRIGHDLVIQNIGISTKYGYNSKYFWYVLTPEVALCLASLLNFATTQAPLILLSLIEASWLYELTASKYVKGGKPLLRHFGAIQFYSPPWDTSWMDWSGRTCRSAREAFWCCSCPSSSSSPSSENWSIFAVGRGSCRDLGEARFIPHLDAS